MKIPFRCPSCTLFEYILRCVVDFECSCYENYCDHGTPCSEVGTPLDVMKLISMYGLLVFLLLTFFTSHVWSDWF